MFRNIIHGCKMTMKLVKNTKILSWQHDKANDFRHTLISNMEAYQATCLLLDDPISVGSENVDQLSCLLFNDAFKHFGVPQSRKCKRKDNTHMHNEWYKETRISRSNSFVQTL